MKIIVGVSTYGISPRVSRFIKSYWANTEKLSGHEITNVCCDDGTPDLAAVRERERFCKAWNFNFIRNEKNEGISFTWSRLANFIPDAELFILTHDSCLFLAPGWLSRILHFFEKNTANALCLPFVASNRFNDGDSIWQHPPLPLLSGYPVALFATRAREFPQTSANSWILPWPPCGGDEAIPLFPEILLNDRIAAITTIEKIRWLDKSGKEQEASVKEMS